MNVLSFGPRVRLLSFAAAAFDRGKFGGSVSGARALNLHGELPDKLLRFSSQALGLSTQTPQLSKTLFVRNRHRRPV
jgi:hypothetical protein